jgi:hypothetical protein
MSNDADFLAHLLSEMIADARTEKNPGTRLSLIRRIRRLWDNESWASICKKADTEGSTWVVWWYDGLGALKRELENED